MTIRIAGPHDASKEAGASDEKARTASESVAADEARFSGFDLRMKRLGEKLTLLTWMVGVNTALVLLVLGKLAVS